MLSIFSVFCLIAISYAVGGPVKQKLEQTIFKDPEGNEYALNITEHDKEEDLELTDSHGNLVVSIEYFGKEGLQIDKPANENVCLLVQALEEGESGDCYTRESVNKTSLSEEILKHCEGRDIYVLIPSDENCKDMKQGVSDEEEQSDDSDGLARRKRSWSCRWYTYRTLRCRLKLYCCRSFLGFCTKHCTRYELYYTTTVVFPCEHDVDTKRHLTSMDVHTIAKTAT